MITFGSINEERFNYESFPTNVKGVIEPTEEKPLLKGKHTLKSCGRECAANKSCNFFEWTPKEENSLLGTCEKFFTKRNEFEYYLSFNNDKVYGEAILLTKKPGTCDGKRIGDTLLMSTRNECAVECYDNQGCKSITYNTETKMCSLYSQCDTTTSSDAISYDLNPTSNLYQVFPSSSKLPYSKSLTCNSKTNVEDSDMQRLGCYCDKNEHCRSKVCDTDSNICVFPNPIPFSPDPFGPDCEGENQPNGCFCFFSSDCQSGFCQNKMCMDPDYKYMWRKCRTQCIKDQNCTGYTVRFENNKNKRCVLTKE